MEFCPKCGAILILKTKNYGCPRCDYSTKDKVNLQTSEKQEEKESVGVVSSKETGTLPIVTEICEKCKNNKAYFWTVQTRASDESETKFFKCVKCENTWREYS
ncbi:transcription factor S [Candidatus Pacearchaeota archaeon]|nr:transcription factor S [Candidatus Pacearchaeota archaeon]